MLVKKVIQHSYVVHSLQWSETTMKAGFAKSYAACPLYIVRFVRWVSALLHRSPREISVSR